MPPNPALIQHGQPTLFDFFALEDTNSTQLVKSGRGFFHSLTVTGGTAGTITLYDNTEGSGTVIAKFVSTNALETYLFDIAFQTGLEVETTAVDTPRLTITYK